jgi:hypothetical protein
MKVGKYIRTECEKERLRTARIGKLPWNKGLTKETNIVVKEMSIKYKEYCSKEEVKKEKRERILGEKNPAKRLEVRKKMSQNHSDISDNKNPMYKSGSREKLSIKLKKVFNTPEYLARISGPNSCHWKGGIAFEPYCNIWGDKYFKEIIKDRDHHTCQRCGITEMLSFKVYNQGLTIHHINYNKKDCHLDNLITICVSCNCTANFNREYWQNLYNFIICGSKINATKFGFITTT